MIERDQSICEYCHLPRALHPWPFEEDHIIARQHGGAQNPANLATACPNCNRHKGPNIAGIDPNTGNLSRLFNPRNDIWQDHFYWIGAELVGKTSTARATIAVLKINEEKYVRLRAELIAEGVFPTD